MQDHHISGGRTHQKDAISFRFRDNSHAPFSSLERGKILKFQKIRIINNASHAGYETEACDIKNQKTTLAVHFIHSSDHKFQEIHQIKNLVNNMLQQNDVTNWNNEQ